MKGYEKEMLKADLAMVAIGLMWGAAAVFFGTVIF